LGRAGRVDGVEGGHSCRSLARRCLKHLFQEYGDCNVYTMMVSAQIDAHLRELTPAERRVAAVVADDPEAVAFGTVADVARRAGASGATVVRLAAKLGFDGFVELQAAVREEMARRLRPASERIRRPAADAGPAAVVVVLDLARYDRAVLDAAGRAAERGAALVALTDSALSPLASAAVVSFTASVTGAGPFDSHVGLLALANALLAGVA